MKTLPLIALAGALLGASGVAYAAPGAGPSDTFARSACQPGESWTLGPALATKNEELAREFQSFLASPKSPVLAFSQALAMRRYSQGDAAKALSEFWISRSLFEAGMAHIAHSGFAVLAAREPSAETAGVQLAALECLLQLEDGHPSLALPVPVAARLQALQGFAKVSPRHAAIVWNAATRELRGHLNEGKLDSPRIEKDLALLAGGGAYEAFGRGLLAAQRHDHNKVVTEFRKLLAAPVIPAPLQRFTDFAHIEIARSLYAMGDYDRSVQHFKNVSKKSNELAQSLSELSWAYLQGERFSEAIGTAMSLQAGGLRHTFTPEAVMVMAMALNELCQYPESVKASNLFKKNFEASYRWLSKWKDLPETERGNLYPLAVQYLKRSGKTPAPVASEWIRSPLFIANQEELNLFIDEKAAAERVGKSGGAEQRLLGQEIVKSIQELRPRIRLARKKIGPEAPLPENVAAPLRALKGKLIRYRRLQSAAPVWRNILASHERQAEPSRVRLIAAVNADLKRRSYRMVDQLDEIMENLQLVEIEIYNGASQDIIWQNAHPDYKEVAETLKNEKEKAQAGKVWDWGRSAAGTEESTEIWEDELGSFKADLFDNCSSKDKYLALKLKKKKEK
ncbi:MAG: hypothetical protein NDJ90_13510 [Oligoflexia bacterium]|nr:hypothetical protein [Oligoflexia bacterium]